MLVKIAYSAQNFARTLLFCSTSARFSKKFSALRAFSDLGSRMLDVESRISDVDSGCGISNVRCRMAPISFRTRTKKELGQFVKQTYQKGKRRRNVREKVNSQQDRTLKLIMAAHHLLSGLLVFIEHDSLWIQHKDMQNTVPEQREFSLLLNIPVPRPYSKNNYASLI